MDPQHIIDLALGAISAILGWIAKTIYAAVKTLELDLASHKVDVAKTYATRNDLLRFEDKIDSIHELLRDKADK